MSSPYQLPADLTRPAAFRWLAYYFLWVAHLVEPLPFATILGVVVFIVAHLDVLRLPRRWPVEMILAVVIMFYVLVLLVLHRTIFDVSMGELAQSVRIPYRLSIFLMFALCDYRLALEGPMLKTGLRVGGVLAAVSLFYYVTDPNKLMFEKRFVAGDTIVGLMGNHNVMASAMGALCVGVFAWWLHKRAFHMRWELSLIEWAMLPFIAVAFVLAKSRSFLLAALCVGIYAGFVRRGSGFIVRLATVALTIVVIIAGAYVISTRDSQNAENNIQVRMLYYRRAADMIPLSPLIGIGVGTFSEENVQYRWKVPGLIALRYKGDRIEEKDFREVSEGAHVHNMYLETMLDVGLVGTLMLALFFYYGVQRYMTVNRLARMAVKESPFLERACLNGDLYMTSLVFLLISGFFSGFTLFGVPSSLILYAAMGRLVAMSQRIDHEELLSDDEEYSEVESPVAEPQQSLL